jgi:hypothetical protein
MFGGEALHACLMPSRRVTTTGKEMRLTNN